MKEQPVESLTITPIWLFPSSRLCVLHLALSFSFSCHFQWCTSWHTVQAGEIQPEEAKSIQMYSSAIRPFERAPKQFWWCPQTTELWDCWSVLSSHHALLMSLAGQDLFLVVVKIVNCWMVAETYYQKLPKLDYWLDSSTNFASLSFFGKSMPAFQCFSSSSRDPSVA